MKTALKQAMIVLLPTYLVAYMTDKMIYTIPMLAAAGFIAASYGGKTERRVEEDGYRKDNGEG